MRDNEMATTADAPLEFEPAPPPEPPDRAPKRGAKAKPAAKRAPTSTARLETRIGAFLVQSNTMLLQIPAIRADALDSAELTLLAKGIADECARHAAFRRYVEAMLDISAGGGLIMTVAIIAGRRAARHNVIPAGVLPFPNEALDGMLGQVAIMAARSDSEIMRQAQQQPPAISPEQNGKAVTDAGTS
jgi:hypothetical protein